MKNAQYMTIDGIPVEIDGEESILALIHKAGLELPTLCHHGEIPLYGDCRMCMVETAEGTLEFACSTPPRPGLRIKTDTPEITRYRRVILDLLLARPLPDRLRELAEWLALPAPAGGLP
jgi:NADH-quinone oxidoreductase subunit G